MESESKSGAGGRNYGIDLFRCVSMLMVVILHTLNRGGALGAAKAGSAEAAVGWFLEAASYGAVNSYALISGYVGWNRKWKPSRIVSVWVQVLFYTTLAALLFIPTGMWEATDEALRYSFMPIFSGHYWYITSYIALMVLAPFLNEGIARVTKKEAVFFACMSAVLFMILPRTFESSAFGLSGGYSVLWLAVCYIYGGLLSRFEIGKSIPQYALFLIFIASSAITCVTRIAGSQVLLSYISPTVFIGSASLCVMFAKMEKFGGGGYCSYQAVFARVPRCIHHSRKLLCMAALY